jgi:hypothetical protein
LRRIFHSTVRSRLAHQLGPRRQDRSQSHGLDCRVGSRQPDAIYIRPRVEKEILLMWCTTIWRTTGEAGIVVLAERDPEGLMQPLVLQLVIH